MFRQDDSKIQQWQPNKAYNGGDIVTHNGKVYNAKWWTRGDIPDKITEDMQNSPWMMVSEMLIPDTDQQPFLFENIEYPDYSTVDVGQGIRWPEKAFVPIIDATSWPPLKFADMMNELNLPYVNLGFIVSENHNSYLPSWGTYYAAQDGPLKDQIKKIREMGGDVTVTFGGVTNVPLQVTAPNPEILKEQYKAFIKAYGLTRVHFDIDGPWLKDEESIVRNNKALNLLQKELKEEGYDLGIWFTLPTLQTGLTPLGLNVLKSALREGVNFDGVNIKTMNFGTAVPRQKMGIHSIRAAKSLKNQLKMLLADYGVLKSDINIYRMIGITPMIGMNDVTIEIFNLEDAKEVLLFAEQNDIGLLSMWSLNRDKQCPGGKTSYVSISCSSIYQQPYEFSSIFNQYNDLSYIDIKENFELAPEIQQPDIDIWIEDEIYEAGDIVSYKGKVYEAKWWNQGETPDKEVSYPWETPWERIE